MTAEPRPYLRSDDRRRQLLDAAARLFVRDGLTGITMAALAREATASRRLVYDHFPDLAALYEAFFDDRSARYLDRLDEAIDAAGDANPIIAAFKTLLSVPPEDQLAMRLLVAGTPTPELEGLRARVHKRLEDRWMALLGPTPSNRHLSKAALWTSMGTVLALADLVSRDELTAEEATDLASAAVHALAKSAATKSSTLSPT